MKKILSLIFLIVFVSSCSNDENEEFLYNEIQKSEAKNKVNFGQQGKDSSLTDLDSIILPPPPPIYGGPGEICEGCPVDIDPPKGGTKP